MITPEILIAIAVWCGQPVNSTKGSLGFKTGVDTSVFQVNECRKSLLICMGPVDPKDEERRRACFEKMSYPGS